MYVQELNGKMSRYANVVWIVPATDRGRAEVVDYVNCERLCSGELIRIKASIVLN